MKLVSTMRERHTEMPYAKASNRHLPRLVVALAWVCIFGASANADTIFNDFGTGDSTLLAEYCVDGTSIASFCSTLATGSDGLAPAALFVSPGNYDVAQIDVSLSYTEGTNSALISLYTDASNAPGTLLGSWAVSGQPYSVPPVTTVSGISGITLTSGTSYFLQITAGGASTEDGWSENDLGLIGEVYDPPYGGSDLTLPAFDVLGTPLASVPEPSSFVISGTALLALLAARRRQHSKR
jgi:hypothetical protein